MAADTTTTPLIADYFWIAGLDSLSYTRPNVRRSVVVDDPTAITDDADDIFRFAPPETIAESESGSENESLRLSFEKRQSSATIRDNPHIRSSVLGQDVTGSNRSSRTITGLTFQADSDNKTQEEKALDEFNFDDALKKFAAERDQFLDDLSFSAGTIVQKPIYNSSKAQKIVTDDGAKPTRGITGSIRRRISIKELTSNLKRNPSLSRTSPSIKTARRVSNYNSVIPTPQPLHVSPEMHPLKRKFEPVLLDRYPPKHLVDEATRRGPFPDYVPMFAFPNDINVVSSDARPRSTWHGFAMTTGDGSKMYGLCVTVWLPVSAYSAKEIEDCCEEWRRNNMSEEERELAASLGERLAAERAKLSRLLARLPGVVGDSSARDYLDDEISATEEKIGLMTDLLRPVRHGAASKIEGLTDGDTGLWLPRAYGVMGSDIAMAPFWKEWLKAIIVPMANSGVLRIPASSPRIGMWQPLERYVVNLFSEAPSPQSSKTQVELWIRELRLVARRDADNELPGSRSTDLYALFRSLSIQNIVTLFEYVLAESRVILLSSHTAMLHLASRALVHLLYPLQWAGIYIPVLPARLISALEAPCPYIVGVERRYENLQLPDEDFVCCDLDENVITATDPPKNLPRTQRKKLISLLQLAAPHHIRYGVPIGPPAYAIETFPFDTFSSETPSVFTNNAPPSTLSRYASLSSAAFGESSNALPPLPLIFNAFLKSKNDQGRFNERPRTNSANKVTTPPSPSMSSFSNIHPFPPSTVSRADSGFALANTLKEKRSGLFEAHSRRGSTNRLEPLRRPSLPFSHASSSSTSTLSIDSMSITRSPKKNSDYTPSMSNYAPSTYAASTIAPSTIMPSVMMSTSRNTDSSLWVEGHGLQWKPNDMDSVCAICEENTDEGVYHCSGCAITVHSRCAEQVCLVCPAAFHEDQIRAAFARCFTSLFFTYRKYLQPSSGESKVQGKLYRWNGEGFLKSVPREASDYLANLMNTQCFNEFLHERETLPPQHPSIRLFDQLILSKKNRGTGSMFSRSNTSFLTDITQHIWKAVTVPPPISRYPGDYRTVTTRIPSKLDPVLMKPGKESTVAATTVRPMQFEFGVGKEAAYVKATATNVRNSKTAPKKRPTGQRPVPPSDGSVGRGITYL